MWQRAFVAVSVAVGEPLDAALAALGDDARAVTQLTAALRVESREARARALAAELAHVAAAIEALEMTWHG
jgi:hypothetical protein